MRLDEAKARVVAAVSDAGYDPVGLYLRRSGIGWAATGEIAHRWRNYRTTRGHSNRYDTYTWGLTLARVVRKVEDKFAVSPNTEGSRDE